MRITVKELKRIIKEAIEDMPRKRPPTDPNELKTKLKSKFSGSGMEELVLDMDDLRDLTNLEGEVGEFFKQALGPIMPKMIPDTDFSSNRAPRPKGIPQRIPSGY